MLKILLIICVANTLTVVLCTVTTSASVDKNEKSLERLWQSNSAFTHNFLNLKMRGNIDESFVASPFSMLLPLAQLMLYAKGASLQQFSNIFRVGKTGEIRDGFRKLLDNFKSPKNVTLSLAQKVFGNKHSEFAENFLYDSEVYFDSRARNLDFKRSVESAKIINDWVNKHTHGFIPSLVEPKMFNSSISLLLVNALYFKGNWLYPFDPAVTAPDNFYMASGDKKEVKMMNYEGNFRYMENPTLQVKAVELLYKDEDYSFLCVLPTYNNTKSLQGLYNRIQDPKVFEGILNELSYYVVQLKLPLLKISTETNFKVILKALNVTDIFDEMKSNINGILKNSGPLFVSEVIQKSLVIVNELGSEAAAANEPILSILTMYDQIGLYLRHYTAAHLLLPTVREVETYIDVISLVVASGVIDSPKLFMADRPFLYFILYKKNILFCGAYAGT